MANVESKQLDINLFNHKLNKTLSFSPNNNSEFNRVLSNLKIISTVSANQKLAVRNNTLVIHNNSSWQDWAGRVYNGDNRQNIMVYLQSLSENIQSILNDGNIHAFMKEKMQRQITFSLVGLRNLQNSYWADVSTRCQIETIVEGLIGMCPDIPQS